METHAFSCYDCAIMKLVTKVRQNQHGHLSADGFYHAVESPVGDEGICHLQHLQLGATPSHNDVGWNFKALEGLRILRDGCDDYHILVVSSERLKNSLPQRPAKIPAA